jgi:hypothetical protein
MPPRELAAFAVVVVLLAFPVTASATAPSFQGTAQTTPAEPPVSENTTLALQIQANGDARWTITDSYALDGPNETSAFEDLGRQYADGDVDTGWERSFRSASNAASEATGREMRLTNVSRDYRATDERGELLLQFTWTNFATTNGSQIRVQDGFNTTDGTWLPRLYENQTLVISPPPGYGVTGLNGATPTDIDDSSIVFEGPRTFEPGYLNIVYEGDQGQPLMEALPLVLAAVFVLLAGAFVYSRRRGGLPAGGALGGDGAAGGSASDDGDDDIDVELLSDEERVERLLEENGGRMKQARIVKETGWSNAKVSQLLSSMDDEGRIDKLRIGRENLISFPDEDVTEIED